MGDNKNNNDVIFDPLLAYAISVRDTASPLNIKAMILARFTPEHVKVAREALWDKSEAVLGELPERRVTKNRTVKEAHVDDIIDALGKLDGAQQIPCVAVRADQLHLIPRCRPEEIDVVSLVERVSAIEETLNFVNNGRPSNVGGARGVPRQNQEASSTTRQSRAPLPRLPGFWYDDAMQRTRSNSRGSVTVPKKTTKPTLAEVLGTDADAPFTEVTRKKRKKAPNRGTKGTAGSACSLKGGSITFSVQLTNVNPKVTVTDIKKYVADKGIAEPKEVEDTTTEGWPTKRFRVTFPREVFQTVMSADFWPENVYFRQFFQPRGTSRRNSNHYG